MQSEPKSSLNDIDFDYLVDFCRTNLAARVLMETLSHRKKNSWTPTIKTLQRLTKNNGYNFSESEIRTCCKGLRRAKCGSLRRAYKERKGHFQCGYSPIEVSKEVTKRLSL